MDVTMISEIFRDRFPKDEEFRQFSEAAGLEFRQALDAIAVNVGQRFLEGRLTYEDGDEIMNTLWAFALQRDEIPETMYAVYEAFDAGEYFREKDGRDSDPVERYTRPALAKLLGGNRTA